MLEARSYPFGWICGGISSDALKYSRTRLEAKHLTGVYNYCNGQWTCWDDLCFCAAFGVMGYAGSAGAVADGAEEWWASVVPSWASEPRRS